MNDETKNIVLMFIVLALFTGGTIQLSEGSTIIGILLLLVAILVVSRIKLTGKDCAFKNSRAFMFAGFFVMASIVIFKAITGGSIGTLVSMIFIIGASLFAMGICRQDIRQLGEFGFYISSVFTAFYLVFYTLFGMLNIGFLHNFNHFFVLMPTVELLKLTGIPVEIVATETITIQGVSDTMTIIIGGPCSGLYSMFLLIGIVVAYTRMENIDIKKSFMILLFAVCVAYVANLARVFTLYVVAYLYGTETMMVFHTHLGWVIFAGTAGLIMYIMNRKDVLGK